MAVTSDLNITMLFPSLLITKSLIILKLHFSHITDIIISSYWVIPFFFLNLQWMYIYIYIYNDITEAFCSEESAWSQSHSLNLNNILPKRRSCLHHWMLLKLQVLYLSVIDRCFNKRGSTTPSFNQCISASQNDLSRSWGLSLLVVEWRIPTMDDLLALHNMNMPDDCWPYKMLFIIMLHKENRI